MRVILSPKARETIAAEARYLRSRNPRAARQFSEDISNLAQNLARFPEMGRKTKEIPVRGVLRFVMGAYLVDYELTDNAVRVFAFRHGRERPPGLTVDDDVDFEER